VRGFGGELRYNAILNADDLAWISQPFENTKIHHNLFLMCSPPDGAEEIQGGIQLVNRRASGIEIFNNTLDGGGSAIGFGGPAISVADGCFLDSLRSNLIRDFELRSSGSNPAAIRPGAGEGASAVSARIGYADYNLFFNPGVPGTRNYGLAVPNRTVRADPGFALNDARAGGPVDEQVDPRLAGVSDGCFPWTDQAIQSGEVRVSDMLAYWRASYTPDAGSPALAAGDPNEGAGNAIGAVGDGTLANDRFGRFAR
jgi:hypothetical protein